MSFLILPTEIRYMIYRELRTLQSPILPPRQRGKIREMGYCSYGFRWAILATSRLILHEAQQIFYGENDWTFFVNLDIPFDARSFMLSPLASNLSLMRKIHIRFRLFNWTFFLGRNQPCLPVEALQGILTQMCKILVLVHHVQIVKLIWTETSILIDERDLVNCPWRWTAPTGSAATILQTLIYYALQPLARFPYRCSFEKSTVAVQFRSGHRSHILEAVFSNAVDALITLRNSMTFPQHQENPSPSLQISKKPLWSDSYSQSNILSTIPPGYQQNNGSVYLYGVVLGHGSMVGGPLMVTYEG